MASADEEEAGIIVSVTRIGNFRFADDISFLADR